jgi:quinol monooxygenase YgiN
MKMSGEKRQELTQTVTSLLSTISTEKGCGRCDFFQGIEDENILCLFEEWDTAGNFANHRKSDYFKVLSGVMHLLEEPCKIISYTASETL